jgi:class 3 adenylate cyclase
LAHAGEVVLTAATRAEAEAALAPGQLQPRGRRRLKNVTDPVELYALVPKTDAADRLPSTRSAEWPSTPSARSA